MYKPFRLILIMTLLFALSSCSQPQSAGKIGKVGLLVSDTINDQVWGTKGYKGLLKIQSKFNIDVFYKEGINSKIETELGVRDFVSKGVNLIFGHGSDYAEHFDELAEDYPDVHFIAVNGNAKKGNVTSLNFEGHAMGFFGGMVAGEMTKTNKVGIIAAYEWQPEVNGFFEGAGYQNENVDVKISFVESWDEKEPALEVLDRMIENGVDVIYPAGDGYNVPVIEKIKESGLYAIGFVSDQSDMGEETVLTSTVQHVDKLYEIIADRYNNGTLESGNLTFDFQDGVITMGKYSQSVDKDFQQEIERHIEEYRQTGLLPNQQRSDHVKGE
jgi:transcriptional activator of comK gene